MWMILMWMLLKDLLEFLFKLQYILYFSFIRTLELPWWNCVNSLLYNDASFQENVLICIFQYKKNKVWLEGITKFKFPYYRCFESGLKFKYFTENTLFSKKDIVKEIFICPYFLYNSKVAINVVVMGRHNNQ